MPKCLLVFGPGISLDYRETISTGWLILDLDFFWHSRLASCCVGSAEFATADIRAAKDLGYNTQEYLWVKGQILAASTAAFAEKMTDAMSAQMDAAQQQTKKAYEEAKDEQTKQMYKQMLDSYAQTVKEGKDATANQDPALAYNRALLKKYDTELAAFTNEMSKYENKDGDAKKSMDDLQKKMDQAAQDAKKSQ